MLQGRTALVLDGRRWQRRSSVPVRVVVGRSGTAIAAMNFVEACRGANEASPRIRLVVLLLAPALTRV